MKQLFLAVAIVATMVACGKKEDTPKPQKLDPDAMILLKPDANAFGNRTAREAEEGRLSALEIVKQADNLAYAYNGKYGRAGFGDWQRDTVNVVLKMFGTDIIDQEGNYVPAFIEGVDAVLERVIRIDAGYEIKEEVDTIGYLPNSVLRQAQPLIKQAYDAGNYDEVYRLFHEAFTFRPITGAEWRELKARGEQ